MRLFRTFILLGAAGLFLPSPPDEVKRADGTRPSTLEMISSAGAAAADAWSFCSRQPEVCGVASYLAGRLSAKALYSASLVWGWAGDEKPAKVDAPYTSLTVMVEDGATDSPAPVILPPGPRTQSTLSLDDLIPEWRGPAAQAQKDG